MSQETNIHPTAIIEDGAQLGQGVAVGPFCHIGAEVEIGDGTSLHSHIVIAGRTQIGAACTIYPFASIGHQPQDLKYHGEASRLQIGDRNQIREYVTMHPGTEGGGMLTKVGDDGLYMIGAHIAHDCQLGDHVILANNATLAGHVVVEDYAFLGGLCAVHQFVRIGKHAMIGGMSGVENDVIPYGLVMGERARLSGLNLVGLERRGFDKGDINQLRKAYKFLFGGDGTFADRMATISDEQQDSDNLVTQMMDFIKTESSRGICQPK